MIFGQFTIPKSLTTNSIETDRSPPNSSDFSSNIPTNSGHPVLRNFTKTFSTKFSTKPPHQSIKSTSKFDIPSHHQLRSSNNFPTNSGHHHLSNFAKTLAITYSTKPNRRFSTFHSKTRKSIFKTPNIQLAMARNNRGKEVEASPPRGRGERGRAPTRGRGKRARVGESSSGIPSVPGYEEITFATQAQKDRFLVLQGMPMNSTRFLSKKAMVTLGLDDMMKNLFVGTGLRDLYGMQEPTYRSLTLEFLSSFRMDETTFELTFRVQNENYSLRLVEFGNYFNFGRSTISKAPEEFSGHALWNCISHKPIRGFSNVRVNNIQHPALRLWFRTVTGTIFGRSEVGTLNFTELSILGGFLNVQRGNRYSLDLPYLVAKHMLDVAENRIKTIEIGGVITYLINAMGFDSRDLIPVDANERWIDCEYLRASHHWLQRSRGVYRWRIAKDPIDRFIILPSDRLPALNSLRAGEGGGLPSYLIPEDIDEQNMEIEREQPPMRTHEEASSSNPPPTPHEIYMAQFNFMNQRFTHHAVNQNLESYWQYHSDVESGLARGPHPTYYRGGDTSGIFEEAGIDPNSWGPNYHQSYGGFGGQFLDEFGRLNVSGGANDGGANDDEDDED